ncbi:MAG: hypothetical protein ACE5HL_08350 [Terriglobia bacterium]
MDAELILSGVIALAVVGQFYIAYRLWRLHEVVEAPRRNVEVYFNLRRGDGGTATLDVANLSGMGVYVERLTFRAWQLGVKEGERGPVDQLANIVIPPFNEKSCDCKEPIFRLLKTDGPAPHIGTVRIEMRYRALGRWFSDPRSFAVSLSDEFVSKVASKIEKL